MSETPRSEASPQGELPETAASKPPEEWVTGGEPATGPQLSYLETLAHDVGEQVPEHLTKAAASELIDELRSRSPRVEG